MSIPRYQQGEFRAFRPKRSWDGTSGTWGEAHRSLRAVDMQFRERHPEILERFDRFWRGTDTDRPVLFITLPREDPDTSIAPPVLANPADRVLPENMLAEARYRLSRIGYLAEGYPHFFVNFGPGILHGCIGGEPDFSSPDTVWFPPFLRDIEDFAGLSFHPEGRSWELIASCTKLLLEQLGDEIVVSFTDIGGVADILASAIGTEQLLLDVVERPEAVKGAVAHCRRLWMEAYELNHSCISSHQDVTTPWWPVLSPGKTYMTQSDFNSMISPQVFSDLFVEELEATWDHLDHPCFHLDGIGTEVQVPALLAKGNLRCIQWVPAPGASPLDHAAMLRHIQEAGVAVTFAIKPEEVERACRILDPRRLMLSIDCDSVAEGKRLIEDSLRWSANWCT